jgi:DNA-binding CsgD family transcriptional regulator
LATLTARDAEHVLRFVATAEELGGDDPFTPEVLEELGHLVEADHIAYCELDRVRQRERLGVSRPGDEEGEPDVSYWEITDEHPVCSRHNGGFFGALKLSDFASLKALRKSRIYALWFRPGGVERELNVAIPSPPWHTKTFLFDRELGRRDFTERDRLVLDLLQPHFARLWHGARVRRQLRAALESLEGSSEQDGRAVILLGAGGVIEFESPAARRLLREYFGANGRREISAPILEWFESGSPTLARRRGEHRLTISRAGSTLLLEEARDELALTSRERQVLAWVARGKTNSEVAQILWVTPATVRKHLENVYAKLGVHTRTAAVTRFLGVLDSE